MTKKDDFPIDMGRGIRRALKNTIFAHPDDIKVDKKRKIAPKK